MSLNFIQDELYAEFFTSALAELISRYPRQYSISQLVSDAEVLVWDRDYRTHGWPFTGTRSPGQPTPEAVEARVRNGLDMLTMSGFMIVEDDSDPDRDDYYRHYVTTPFIRDLLIQGNGDAIRQIQNASDTFISVADSDRDVRDRTHLTITGRNDDIDKAFRLLKNFEDEAMSRTRA